MHTLFYGLTKLPKLEQPEGFGGGGRDAATCSTAVPPRSCNSAKGA